MTAKKPATYGALVRVPGLDPKDYIVQVLVRRRDGAAMEEADLAKAEKALPRAETFDDLENAETQQAPARKSA